MNMENNSSDHDQHQCSNNASASTSRRNSNNNNNNSNNNNNNNTPNQSMNNVIRNFDDMQRPEDQLGDEPMLLETEATGSPAVQPSSSVGNLMATDSVVGNIQELGTTATEFVQPALPPTPQTPPPPPPLIVSNVQPIALTPLLFNIPNTCIGSVNSAQVNLASLASTPLSSSSSTSTTPSPSSLSLCHNQMPNASQQQQSLSPSSTSVSPTPSSSASASASTSSSSSSLSLSQSQSFIHEHSPSPSFSSHQQQHQHQHHPATSPLPCSSTTEASTSTQSQHLQIQQQSNLPYLSSAGNSLNDKNTSATASIAVGQPLEVNYPQRGVEQQQSQEAHGLEERQATETLRNNLEDNNHNDNNQDNNDIIDVDVDIDLNPVEEVVLANSGQQRPPSPPESGVNSAQSSSSSTHSFDVPTSSANLPNIEPSSISLPLPLQQQTPTTRQPLTAETTPSSGTTSPAYVHHYYQHYHTPSLYSLQNQQQQQQEQRQQQELLLQQQQQYSSHNLHMHPHPCLPSYSQRTCNKIMFSSTSADNANGASSSTAPTASAHPTTSAGITTNPNVDRIKLLYPNVNEDETPLPRCWSPEEKCPTIGLSLNNLRVHYKGVADKTESVAASVRTAHPIPAACGIYYFEVTIISKSKNGYMGIGLTAQQFRMNRLPGCDKQSYGYHGGEGNSFASAGHGQSYGPTFTTGDIIGCCVNFINNTCFYTKNGLDLGIAFRDLPSKLYPTIGLQAPGEEVDANFGQEPFKFDQIEEMMKQMRTDIKANIYDFPLPIEQGDPTTLLQKMVTSYLVHNGYSETAEAFVRTTGQTFPEDINSIRNRQKILKLIMSGKMSLAIEHTINSYPGLLENNKNLWFMLKCRQFIEMINGSDIEYCPTTIKTTLPTPISSTIDGHLHAANSTAATQPPLNQTSVIQSTKSYQNGSSFDSSSNQLQHHQHQHQQHSSTEATSASSNLNTKVQNPLSLHTITAPTTTAAITTPTITASIATSVAIPARETLAQTETNSMSSTTIADVEGDDAKMLLNNERNSNPNSTVIHNDNVDTKAKSNLVEECSASADANSSGIKCCNNIDYINDVEMESNLPTINGDICKNGVVDNFHDSIDADEEMDVDVTPSRNKYSSGIERILEFGRDLSQMGQQLEKENKMTDEDRQMLEDAFSLIAYSNPWSSPLGWQLCPTKRDSVCTALNSAILESMSYPRRPPLNYCAAHANELLKIMAQASLSSCAFVNINDIFQKN